MGLSQKESTLHLN